MSENILEIRNLSKQYPGVRALDDISIDVRRGVCHCVCGENGAGKSTLIKILAGAETRTAGSIRFNAREFAPGSIKDAMAAGMSYLFQELNVVEQLRVDQNISLGMEDTRYGIIRNENTNAKVYEILNRIDPSIHPKSYVADLSVAKRQIIEIVKAVATDSTIIIMDEPTAALSAEEGKRLFAIIDELKKQHVTIIYISHRLDEIFEIGDEVTVLRDGRVVGTKSVAEIGSRAELIRMMIGKVIVEGYVPSAVDRSTKVLEAEHLSNRKLKDVSFALYKGELLGFYGLIGAGKTEIARALFGADRKAGTTRVFGRETRLNAAYRSIRSSVALVPEERRTQGLCTSLSLSENVPMMNFRSMSSGGITSTRREKALARSFIQKINIACRDENHVVAYLSGGNQQKVVLSKCLNAQCRILLLDEPTRGVDVGAKQEIYAIIRGLSRQGRSVIVFSSELPEIMNVCDRIILLYEGAIVAEMQNDGKLDAEAIMHIVTGGG
jgi:ABC-type sugar transport system ATPase subunit